MDTEGLLGKPFCAIWVVTYNQEGFISQTLDSILQQKTSFPFKLYIGDDCSTDGTRAICLDYKARFPNQIELIFNDINLMRQNSRNVFNACIASGAKYIAMCEGDDYWTDDSKLQKQVDYLELNQQYILCFTRGLIQNEFTKTTSVNSSFDAGYHISIQEMIAGNSQLTATALFVNKPGFELPDWFGDLAFGDWALYLLLMHRYQMNAYCLPDVSVVYRIHGLGTHGNAHSSVEKLLNAYKMHITFYKAIYNKLLRPKFHDEIRNAVVAKSQIITELYCQDKKYFKSVGFNVDLFVQEFQITPLLRNLSIAGKLLIKQVFFAKAA
jgi:glycosyltransferase involved in cell wall biosynthesis